MTKLTIEINTDALGKYPGLRVAGLLHKNAINFAAAIDTPPLRGFLHYEHNVVGNYSSTKD